MKIVKVIRHGYDTVEITAPDDKSMVFDAGMLPHGILSIGEYGTSGLKLAAFAVWDYAIFDGESHGYIINEHA